MKPSADTKRFWLMPYAMEGFSKIVTACDYILQDTTDVNGEECDRTITAILSIYGRAWHKNRGVGKLDEVLIPRNAIDLHRRLMEERDQAHAHKDANGLTSSIGNVNQIRLLRLRTGFTWFCGNRVVFDKNDIKGVRQLCKTLIEKLDYHTNKPRHTSGMDGATSSAHRHNRPRS